MYIFIDRDYKDSNVRTEEARLNWESSMYRCCRHLESLERVRLEEVSSVLSKYTQILLTVVSPLQEVRRGGEGRRGDKEGGGEGRGDKERGEEGGDKEGRGGRGGEGMGGKMRED